MFQHFKTQLRRVNETTTNQQNVVLKISQREIDYHTFNCWCSLNVGFLLCNLFEEKNSKREIDSLNFIVVVIFKRCWYLSILTKELAATFWSSYNWRKCVKVIIKKASRAKNEVGKRSKWKKLDRAETQNGKPGKHNLNKRPLRALIRRINKCCQSIIPE